MSNKKRNLYIDVMKGLLITLVVIGHLQFFEYDSRTLTLIYSFHMHAFLIIGGILSHVHENTKFSTILLKRIKGTLLPYFLFYIISLILIPTATLDQKFKAAIVMLRGIGDPINAINLPLWFLTFYFVAMLVFEIIQFIAYRIKVLFFDEIDIDGSNEKFGFVMLITLIFISGIMYISYLYARYYKMPRIPFNVEIAGFCLGFIFFGRIIGKYVPIVYNAVKKRTAAAILSIILIIALCTIFVFAWYVTSMKNGRIDLNARDYKNATLMYFDAILGFIIFSVFAFIVSKLPLIKNLFGVFGENSLYILAYHVPSVFVTNAFLFPHLPAIVIETLSHNSIISISILTLFGISFSLIMAFIHKILHLGT